MSNPLSIALQELIKEAHSRPESARLADHFDEIEAALLAGVRRERILQTLHEQGFRMNLATFDNAMSRLRKKRQRPANCPELACKIEAAAQNPTSDAISPAHVSTTVAPTRSAVVSASLSLPEDWRTAKLTPDQARTLSPDQKRERQKAREDMLFPNRFKDPDAPPT